MGGRGASSGTGSKLPKLEGSEKQVKWATEIRENIAKIISEESKIFQKNKSLFKPENLGNGDLEQYKDYLKYSKEALKVTNAGKWINSFKSLNTYTTDSYIKSLTQDKYTDDLAYRSKIKEKMATASYAYKKFVKG